MPSNSMLDLSRASSRSDAQSSVTSQLKSRFRSLDLQSLDVLLAEVRSRSGAGDYDAGRTFGIADVPSIVPESVRTMLQGIAAEERHFLDTLGAEEKAAWGRVEELLQRNQRRVAQMQTEFLGALREVQDVTFWSSRGIHKHFALNADEAAAASAFDDDNDESVATNPRGEGDKATETSVQRSVIAGSGTASSPPSSSLSLNKIRLKSSVALRPNGPPSSRTDHASDKDDSRASIAELAATVPSNASMSLYFPGSSTVGGSAAAEAGSSGWAARDKELLTSRADRQIAPLRRVFRQTLERRRELPKELTILFNEIEELQRTAMPSIENELAKSALHVPVHVPMQRIAQFVSRYLCRPSAGALDETEFRETFQPMLKELSDSYHALRNLWTEQDAQSATKADANETMWRTLLTELATRRDFQSDCDEIVRKVVAHEAELVGTIPSALESCSRLIRSDFEEIKRDCVSVDTAARSALGQTKGAFYQVQTQYHHDCEALEEESKECWYRVTQSLQRQEKCARRVRQAVKEFYQEQEKFVSVADEWASIHSTRAVLDASYAQLEEHLRDRIRRVEAAQNTSESLGSLLHVAEDVCRKLLRACEAHVGRIRTEEFFRKARVASVGIENVAQWLRCTRDLSALYELRSDTLRQKASNSWQLEYLLHNEQQRCLRNCEVIKQELLTVDAAWLKCQEQLVQLQVAGTATAISVDTYDRSEAAATIRSALRYVDEDAVVTKSTSHIFEREAVATLSLVPRFRVQRPAKIAAASVAAGRNLQQLSSDTPVASNSRNVGILPTPEGIRGRTQTARQGSASADPEAQQSRTPRGTSSLPSIPAYSSSMTPKPPSRASSMIAPMR